MTIWLSHRVLTSNCAGAGAVEFATITRSAEGEVLYEVSEAAEIDKLIAETDLGADGDA